MAEAVMPTASPMSSIETELKPLRATRSAAAVRIRCLRAGSRVLAGRAVIGVTRAVGAPPTALGALPLLAAARAFSLFMAVSFADEFGGQVHVPRADVLAEALGLGIGSRRVGDAVAEQSDDHEVQRAQVGQLVALDAQPASFGQQLEELLGCQILPQPAELGRTAGPEADVGVASLVAGAGGADQAERAADGPV